MADVLSQWLITGGLSIDVVGVAVVFFYGLPARVSKGGIGFIALEQDDPDEAAKWERYNFRSRCGGVLILLGFGLQIVGVWI